MTKVEVEAMIQKLAEKSTEDLNWRQSIVDLMKLLKLDSSLKAREQLAKELGYTGALNGSAEMIESPPGDPQEDRPMHDPTVPGEDQPCM